MAESRLYNASHSLALSLCTPVTILRLDADRPPKLAIAAIPVGSTASVMAVRLPCAECSARLNAIVLDRAVHIIVKIGTSQAILRAP